MLQICDLLAEENDSSGSTGLVVVFDGRKQVLTVANVGDSMCVLSRSGKAVCMGRTHRMDNPEERQRVLAAGGQVINNRWKCCSKFSASRFFFLTNMCAGLMEFLQSQELLVTSFSRILEGREKVDNKRMHLWLLLNPVLSQSILHQ